MSAQEGPISCYFCRQKQNALGRCEACAEKYDLDYVVSYRWVRDIYLTINEKQYHVSFSNITDDAEVFLSLEGKVFLRIPKSANLTLENLKEKLKTYFVFL